MSTARFTALPTIQALAARPCSTRCCSIRPASSAITYRAAGYQCPTANNSNAGGGFYSQGGQFYYVRGIGLVRDTNDIGNMVVGSNNGVPIRVRDIGDVQIGHAPRLGQFGFQKNDDAVEGVILMLPRRADTERLERRSGENRRAEQVIICRRM